MAVSNDMMDVFKKIAGASETGGGNLIKPGKYLFEITRTMLKKGYKGHSFIAEFNVISAESSGDQDEKGNPIAPNPVGSTCSYVLNIDKNESAAGNAKTFAKRLLGVENATGDELTQALMELCADDQPARGMLIKDETYQKTIQRGQNAGQPFTGHNWTHVPMTDDQIASRRAALDKADK